MLIFPIFIPHRGCPQSCIFCDQYQISGVIDPDWNDLQKQLKAYCRLHQDEDKEIAFYGGSFTCLPEQEQNELYDKVQLFIDDKTHLRYSTRPDGITKEILQAGYSRGVRTVELGIQDFNDTVLQKSYRGYDREKALEACRSVKANGLKLSVQVMPGLPGYNSSANERTIEDTISVQPDYVRIYPTIVIKGTPLETLYLKGEYSPLDLSSAIAITCEMVERFEAYGITVIKVGLTGIEKSQVVAGPFHPAFGELVRAEMFIKKIVSVHIPNQVLNISKKDISLLLGNKKEYLTKIKHKYNQSAIKINVSEFLEKGEFRYTNTNEFVLW
jgi:histone acetyltransferase (RNA polymerase elongator complex component)